MTGKQNKSSAVMQSRSEPHNSLDDFPTPPWTTRAVCDWIKANIDPDLSKYTVREPAANRGHMVMPLQEYFFDVVPSDIFDYGVGYPVQDYLFDRPEYPDDWTITNPPFRLGQRFIEHAIEHSTKGVAMFVRTAFLEGGVRHEELFSKKPPSHILQFAERVVIHRGKLRSIGEKYWDPDADNGEGEGKGKWRIASSATAYCWLIWNLSNYTGQTNFSWIQKCGKKLEQVGDYDQ
jgi:hypothetical protein